MWRVRALVVIIVLASPGALFAQNKPNQSWLMFEQGNAAAARKEYGLALQLYKEAVLNAGPFPEAEVAIGDVYMEEGEVDLASAQYQKAYTLRNAFYVPDMQYTVLYKLAHVYEGQGLYKQMEDELVTIVNDDKRFSETETLRLRTQIEKNFFDKGLDRVLILYRYSDTFAASAHSQLGLFYYRTGRYAQSASHLLFSALYRMSAMEQFLADRDVDYQYSSLDSMIVEIQRNADLLRYANDAQLFRDLYYLAGSTFALGYPERAASIWKTLSLADVAGSFKQLSLKQLKSPSTEPLLNISP